MLITSEVIVEITTIEMKETLIESPSSILSKEDTTMFSHHIRPNASLTVLTCAQMFTTSSTKRRTYTNLVARQTDSSDFSNISGAFASATLTSGRGWVTVTADIPGVGCCG